MKKLLLAAAIAVMATAAFAQAAPQKTGAEEQDENIQNIRLAHELAEYGYANDSASALLQAAEILAQTPTQKRDDATVTREGRSVENPSETKDFTAASLVADARELAGRDQTMLAWANDIERSLNTRTRGASGGAQYSASFAYSSGGTTSYDLRFDGGRYAEVYVSSLDGADLDLYIYDQNGNLIVQDISYASDAYCSFIPYITSFFHVVVKNNARYNATFELYTN